MDFEPWSKANERDLARHVDAERVKLRLGVNRYDLSSQPDGIRRIVEAIYNELLGAQILRIINHHLGGDGSFWNIWTYELAVSFVHRQQYFVSEASVYRLLKAHDLITSPAFILMKAADTFAEPTTAPNQLWQTDFTYLCVIGWGWFYLSTVLDDFSRYILAWKLCTTMTATDVSDTLAMALRSSGLERVRVRHRPRLLSHNGPSYVSAQLGAWLAQHGMKHTRGKPYHPMTQGKIERYHRSMKNQILLENYYLPGQLEARLAEFVDYYNSRRYHESLNNLTPADVYLGRGPTILSWRENVKLKTIEGRRRLHHSVAAKASTQMDHILS